MAFAHLHVHSQFSLLDGTADPGDLVARAGALGMDALALTDTCNLYGAVPFYKAAKAAGIRPILGAELHVQPEGVAHADRDEVDGGYQIVALVENPVGYRSLCALITRAIFDGMGFKPRIDLDLLRAHADGLIVLTGGRKGAVGRALLSGHRDEARARLAALAGILDADHLFVELCDHGLDGEQEVNAAGRAFASELGLRTVVTNAVHYVAPDDAPVHEVLNAIALGASLGDARRLQAPTDQAYLKTEAELAALFPDDADALARTAEIAARCSFDFTLAKKAEDYLFPATTPPEPAAEPGQPAPDTPANWVYFYDAFPPPLWFGLGLAEGERPPHPPGAGTLEGYCAWYAREGLRVRLIDVDPGEHDAYLERLEYEFTVIHRMGFAAYFLIVAEFINWSKDHDIPVGPGRGSAAGSVVAWAMGITDIDPIRFDLLFERFLNPERLSMPDIDVDFCQDRREEAIEHVRAKYGAELVSQIITYGKLKAKAAVRDVARVLDLPFGDADRIAKLIPDDLKATVSSALEESEQLARMYEGDPKVRRVLDTARRVEGLCRQTGVHAAGVVIADRPLVQVAPLYRDGPDGGPVVQFDMKSAESVGLIKFDFLGLKTLDQIRDAVRMVQANHGVRLDMARIPLDDAVTFELLQRGDALGVFQLESSGMRELLARLKPTVLDDVVALVALYRPGPLNSGMVDDFVDRKHGRQEVSYPHPVLERILQPTYGTIVYQEQVMQIAQVMSGYSLGEADLLRRAMGKKIASEMEKQRGRFVAGAEERGIDGQRASEIFDLVAKFADYGFNKSHSAAYGLVCYQTAWLKAHYRPEYMAALMSIESANTDKLLGYIQDCRRAGLDVLPVCVNASAADFSVPTGAAGDGKAIRFGLHAVKNVGGGSVAALLAAREEGGPFADPLDLFERVDPRALNRRVVENLVKAGAFDVFGVPRAQLFEAIDGMLAEGARRRADQAAGQGLLFGGAGPAEERPPFRYPPVPPWSLVDQLEKEREVLGLYLTGHPMEAFGEEVRRHATCAIRELAEVEADSEVRIIGVPAELKVVKTRRGDRMAFVRLEDAGGSVECVFFAEPWLRSQRALRSGEPVLVTGRLEHGEEESKVLASTAEPISEVRGRTVREVCIDVDHGALAEPTVRRLSALLLQEAGDRPVRLRVHAQGRFDAGVALRDVKVRPSQALVEGVRAIFGDGATVALR
ncbi:MAG: DNA polymerase III subunit alpha [Alphaproteobacteria bacterium]|nr:DNA polymerase III subunit alpha [Alphaproteobacteria bacterium]